MTVNHRPFLLAILDGLALNPNPKANAFEIAKKPTLTNLLNTCPHTTLISYGERVGLPEGQMGNSEVGHLNIGAGRVVEQDLTVINRTAKNNTFNEVPAFKNTVSKLKNNPNSALHLIGLTSPGGVHSQLSHLISLIKSAVDSGINYVFLHIITDGRDRPRDSAKSDLEPLKSAIKTFNQNGEKVFIASVVGRYFAMDRDKRWDRTQKAYDLYTKSAGHLADNLDQVLDSNYKNEVYDEFIDSYVIKNNIQDRTTHIEDGDALLFYNFRADRMRQIVSSFIKPDFDGFSRSVVPKLSSVVSMCEYEADFGIDILFPPNNIHKHLGEIVAESGLTQLRIAETEKYPHVTYFFNGGSEVVLKDEERIMVQSPKDVATYDLKPQMSAEELTDKLLQRLSSKPLDVIILNFANCDMVGHTGSLDAAVKAVETVDTCLGKILDKIKELGGCALITADHGNADQMIDYNTNEPHTYHTMHPVPLIYFGEDAKNYKLNNGGALCDIAPTALEILGLNQPKEMTGKSLLSKI